MNYKLFNGDCLEVMKKLPDKCIDMILCDLPYGTTDCSWDSIIPFEALWEGYERIIKDNGAIVLFGSEPFSSALRMSNLKLYKYDWVWDKIQGANFLNVKYQPLKNVENIMVFSKGRITNGKREPIKYNPQGVQKTNIVKQNSSDYNGTFGSSSVKKGKEYTTTGTGYPKCILQFPKDKEGLHPTQKPVALLEYLVKTYTDENGLVLDNCMGSGSTGVACLNTNRKFIGIELDKNYFNIAKQRIEECEKELETNITNRQNNIIDNKGD
jgi:site-specific DNA-methyltransferase (adenine-specific)